MSQYWKIVCDGCKVSREFRLLKIGSMLLASDIKEGIGDFMLRHVYCGPARLTSDESQDPAYDYPDERCADGHDWGTIERDGGYVWAECSRCGLTVHKMPAAVWDRTHGASKEQA